MINADKLRSFVAKKSNGDSTIAAQLYQMFFFEQLLERISKSKYRHNIILKGGLLLSSIIGEDMRTTKDLDATLKGSSLTKNNVLLIINEVLDININDGVIFDVVDVKDIRDESEYGGFKINLIGKFERLKVNFFVELTTGDVITPREIEYHYNCIFRDNIIPIFAYTVETIIAEKFETLISRSVLNTRYKDFYDLGMLFNEQKYNKGILVDAVKNTFKKRNTDFNIENFKETYFLLKNDIEFKNSWLKYQKKFSWANNITYESIMNNIYGLILLLEEK